VSHESNVALIQSCNLTPLQSTIAFRLFDELTFVDESNAQSNDHSDHTTEFAALLNDIVNTRASRAITIDVTSDEATEILLALHHCMQISKGDTTSLSMAREKVSRAIKSTKVGDES